MPTRRDLLRWASVAPLLASALGRAARTPDPLWVPKPAPVTAGLAAYHEELRETVALMKKIKLGNGDAPDLVPAGEPRGPSGRAGH